MGRAEFGPQSSVGIDSDRFGQQEGNSQFKEFFSTYAEPFDIVATIIDHDGHASPRQYPLVIELQHEKDPNFSFSVAYTLTAPVSARIAAEAVRAAAQDGRFIKIVTDMLTNARGKKRKKGGNKLYRELTQTQKERLIGTLSTTVGKSIVEAISPKMTILSITPPIESIHQLPNRQ